MAARDARAKRCASDGRRRRRRGGGGSSRIGDSQPSDPNIVLVEPITIDGSRTGEAKSEAEAMIIAVRSGHGGTQLHQSHSKLAYSLQTQIVASSSKALNKMSNDDRPKMIIQVLNRVTSQSSLPRMITNLSTAFKRHLASRDLLTLGRFAVFNRAPVPSPNQMVFQIVLFVRRMENKIDTNACGPYTLIMSVITAFVFIIVIGNKAGT